MAAVPLILGVDGGNSKTELVVATPPMLGAALDALDATGAPPGAAARLCAAFESGLPISSR